MAKRYLAILLFAFGITVFFCSFLPLDQLLYALPAVLVLTAVAALIPNRYRKTIVSCGIAVFFAILLSYFSFKPLVDLEKTLLTEKDPLIRGEIVDIGSNSAGTLSEYTVSLTEVNGNEISWFNRADIAIYCDEKDADFEVGQKIEGRVSFFDSPVKFGYGREDRLIFNGYHDAKSSLSVVGENDLLKTFYRCRETIRNQIKFGDEDTVGMLKSICFGDKTALDSEMNISLKRSGLSHVTAVSGLHLSFALFLFYFVLISFRVDHRIRYALGIPIAIAFTALVGFPLSCVRACVMMVLFSLAMALNLFPDSLTSLSVSSFLIILVNPLSVRDIGFLLSFAATAGIILLYGPIENFLFPKKIGSKPFLNKIYRWLTGVFSVSVAASIFTAPITIIAFGSFSLISPFANIILILPIQGLFILGIMMTLLGWIPGIGPVMGWLCDQLYGLIRFVANLLGRIPIANVSGIDYLGIVLLILFGVIFGVAIYDFIRYKRRTFFALFAVFLCFSGVFGALYSYIRTNDRIQIAFIDMGQGDCTVISRGDRAVIIDCGGSSDKRYNVNHYLTENNLYIVEQLAFTHQHNDHINGLNSLLKNAYVDDIIYPKLEFDSPELEFLLMKQDAKLITESKTITVLDGVLLEIIAEPALNKTGSDLNEQCVCYRVSYGDCSVLITGDLTGNAEMKWFNDEKGCSILKVSHHGSDTSSMYPFLKRVAPEIAIISVGENSYGLPDESVLSRIETLSNSTLLTLREGTICYETDGTILERIR